MSQASHQAAHSLARTSPRPLPPPRALFSGNVAISGYSALATTTITGGLTVNGNTNITQGGDLTVGDKVIAPGDIGVGTTTPYAKLAVQGTDPNQTVLALVGTTSQSNPFIDVFSNAGANLFRLTAAGNLGLGTTTPGSIFSVNGVANWTTATSTYYSTGGINLSSGCFAIASTCLPALAGANTWTGLQTLQSGFLSEHPRPSSVTLRSQVPCPRKAPHQSAAPSQ